MDTLQVEDIETRIALALDDLELRQKVLPGDRVAITAGSRGIANIDRIMKATVAYFQIIGAKPFIIPAMGSHAGATAEGQRKLIESYGITEEFCGCPIVSCMDTAIIGQTPAGMPVHMDRHAFAADHILLLNRVKPHTYFAGRIQSGLVKMLAVGLGKLLGATAIHSACRHLKFDEVVTAVAAIARKKCSIVGGVAILENQYGQTADLVAVQSSELESREPTLLTNARRLMPRLPFPEVDLLIVDEIGKDVSGSGIDPNVLGRKRDLVGDDSIYPNVKLIAVRGLTEATRGNACGLGWADLCTTRAVRAMDQQTTRLNCIAAGDLRAGAIPVHFDSDREIIRTAVSVIGLPSLPDARILWLRNTRNTGEIECSGAFLEQAAANDDITVVIAPRFVRFDQNGDLPHIESLRPY